MTDVFTKEERSEVMSKIRSRSGLDRKLFSILDSLKIPHGRYPEVEGSPDARVKLTMVFAQGCFWHGCPEHYRPPKSSSGGVDWRAKIEANTGGESLPRPRRRPAVPFGGRTAHNETAPPRGRRRPIQAHGSNRELGRWRKPPRSKAKHSETGKKEP